MEKSKRNSSIELLRIVAMFMIVLHHYCDASGFIELIQPKHLTGNMLFVQMISIGGKVGVNVFFIITGYFMVFSNMKWRKVSQILFQIFSINVLVFVFLTALGYSYGVKDYLHIIPVIFTLPHSFIGSYMIIYLLSPVINKALKAFERRDMNYLLLVLLFFFSFAQTFLMQKSWNYVGWGFTMYCVGAYVRKYDLLQLRWHFGWITIVTVFVTWIEILALDYITAQTGGKSTLWRFAMTDANKLNMFVTALALFMFFAKLNIKSIKAINVIGGGVCFGVFLLHHNNRLMQKWLWTDFLKNTEYLTSDYLWLHCLLSVVGVYVICTLIELVRYYLIEKPIFEFNKKPNK